MDHPKLLDDKALVAGKTASSPMARADDLSWAVVKMRAVERIVLKRTADRRVSGGILFAQHPCT